MARADFPFASHIMPYNIKAQTLFLGYDLKCAWEISQIVTSRQQDQPVRTP